MERAASMPPHHDVVEEMTVEQLRAEVTALREREAEMAALLGLQSPDEGMVHALRNALNELHLLRVLASETPDD
jgi:hypothetical protein